MSKSIGAAVIIIEYSNSNVNGFAVRKSAQKHYRQKQNIIFNILLVSADTFQTRHSRFQVYLPVQKGLISEKRAKYHRPNSNLIRAFFRGRYETRG